MKLKSFLSVIAALIISATVFSQTRWSIATDLSAIRNFKDGQQFWSVGHTIRGEVHITPKDGPYGWVSYFIPGKFSNDITAVAKLPGTVPQTFTVRNNAHMSIQQFSIGWKHYLKGASNHFESWSLYGTAGFGIINGKVSNQFSAITDTSFYHVPVQEGTAHFKRLTFDVAAGWELPISTEVMFYNEFKCWIPTTDYPSRYLLGNRYVPFIGSVHFGVRIYFE